MADNKNLDAYVTWLEKTLNSYAKECENYVRANDESPSDSLSRPYYALREAWDSYCIVVRHDSAYQPSRALSSFIEAYSNDESEPLELYKVYIKTVFRQHHKSNRNEERMVGKINKLLSSVH